MGKQKHKGDGAQGFKVPSEDIQKKFLETVQEFPNGIFQVSSVSQDKMVCVSDFTSYLQYSHLFMLLMS